MGRRRKRKGGSGGQGWTLTQEERSGAEWGTKLEALAIGWMAT